MVITLRNFNKIPDYNKTYCSLSEVVNNMAKCYFIENSIYYYVDNADILELIPFNGFKYCYAATNENPSEMLEFLVKFSKEIKYSKTWVVAAIFNVTTKKKMKPANANDLILFGTTNEYYTWLKTKLTNNMAEKRNVRSEFEEYAKSVKDLFDKSFDLPKYKEDSVMGALINMLEDAAAIYNEKTGEKEATPKQCECKSPKETCQSTESDLFNKKGTTEGCSCSCKSCRFSFGYNDKMVSISKNANGKAFIDDTCIDDETFNEAIKVIEKGGSSLSIINSLIDVKNEFIINSESKKKNDARKEEILKTIKSLQAELESL